MSTGAWTETAGTLTNTIVTIAANPNRRGLIIGNPSDTVMTCRVGATATAAVGLPIPAGTAMTLPQGSITPALVTVFCAGTSKPYTIYDW